MASLFAVAQEDEVGKAFYDTRIVNGQSVEMNNEGVMKFIIAHRFGRVNSGAYELFGLDQSTIRIGFDYGIKDWLSVGIGRSSFQKTVDGFIKGRILTQKKGENSFPVTVSLFSNLAINGLRWQDTSRTNYFTSRMTYSYQALIARKFSDRISMQLMPSMVHRNLIPSDNVDHDVYAIGTAARFVASKRFTFSFEYYYVLPDQLSDERRNSLAFGIDMETKGHVFQFHFGNSRGMTEKFFITETNGNWFDGDIHFGFNITRDFKVKGRKY
ncbi:MAG: hypothetical protein HKN39_06150 [Flavobacteriales bacterium]|nr:hypothetical protein [Flavobacteriales bacterium]